MNKILKQYIELSAEFRKSNGSTQSVEKLYDFLYQLEHSANSVEEKRILADVYSLLGLHLSAFETFKEVADSKNPKNIAKLYTLESKAKSHKNTFALKDLRQHRAKKSVPKFSISDFTITDNNGSWQLKLGEVLIFNKSIENFSIFVHKSFDFQSKFDELMHYLIVLSDFQTELIDFYNQNITPITEMTADADWYAGLEVYSATVGIDYQGKLFAEIATGDQFDLNHILDFELEGDKIIEWRFDG